MEFTSKTYSNLAYGILIILFLFIIVHCFSMKSRIIQDLSLRSYTNQNSNLQRQGQRQEQFPLREGFGSTLKKNKYNKDEDVITLIERKLKGLSEELGGATGQKEVKSILINTKKICDLECAKCMMSLIEDNKGIKSVDLEKLAFDDSSDICTKCKKYTELSSSIKSMIDSL